MVYNVECLDTKFDQDNEQVASHMKATIANVMYMQWKYGAIAFAFNHLHRTASSTSIVRGGMLSGGVMTKAVGYTSTYGTTHDVQVSHYPNLNAFIQLVTFILGHCSKDLIKKSKSRGKKQNCQFAATTIGNT